MYLLFLAILILILFVFLFYYTRSNTNKNDNIVYNIENFNNSEENNDDDCCNLISNGNFENSNNIKSYINQRFLLRY